MYKNLLISILAVTVMETNGFIQPSNTAAYILAPIVWYFAIMFTLIWVDQKRRAMKKPHEAATSIGANKKYHSYIVKDLRGNCNEN